MFRWQRFYLVLAVYGLLSSVGAFLTAVTSFQIPSDPDNRSFLG